ncbi:FHA domain-containing protein [Hydrogenimonas sp.]|jgi:pSer/pThr/pTyr-binding forkhead associated (FHA) protein|uniref:FHA domain-containing protein n=1 Tax=Hydrogenimonas sp. TaxID=2231112 RepID=UPI00260B47B2|nr:FHA domain-containing protein [Hydrogenimonas sp.]
MPENIDKEKIKKQFLPKAVLLAQTDEAAAAIPVKNMFDDMIPIWKFPFRIGRESRVEIDEHGHIVVKERFKHGIKSVPTNDIYLIDFGERLQISRDHMQIDEEDGHYYLIDDGSKCGSGVNEARIGADSQLERIEIKDGDTIVLGTEKSPYRYTFIVFSGEDAQRA